MAALRAHVEVQEPDAVRVEQELRDFSYLVAHDLGNEFRHVAEFSRLLSEDFGEDGQNAAYARAIVQSASRCQQMLKAILSYSSIQTQSMQIRRWPGRSVVERAVIELSRGGATLAPAISIDVAGDVFADARLLILAVSLALTNAMKFSREGVAPRIAVRGGLDQNRAWRLEIGDNGEGLASEHHEKAFGMFWRLDPNAPGLGVGLPTIRRIARRHGGDARFLAAAEGARLEIVIPSDGAAL